MQVLTTARPAAVQELKAGGFVAKELRKAGYSVDELTKAGFKKRIAEAVDGRTLKELLAEGALTARKGGGREGHYEAHELREAGFSAKELKGCLLYTSPSPRDRTRSRMPSSA